MNDTLRFTGGWSACPAEGALLHALDVSFDAGGGYYTTGKCENCGERREWVEEPLVSGFRGFVCTNDDCPRDS